jgi:hypothetical protein
MPYYKFSANISNFQYLFSLNFFQEIDDHLPKVQRFMKIQYEFLLTKYDIYFIFFQIYKRETQIQD